VRKLLLALLALAALAATSVAPLALADHSPTHRGKASDELLEPEKAFRLSARPLDARTVEVNFAIADGYYMYRDKFRFVADPASGAKLGAPQFPQGVRKKDEFFGEVETYRKQVAIVLPIEQAPEKFDLTVTSQGCADAGVCYAPTDGKVTLRMAAFAAGSAPPAAPPAQGVSVDSSDFEIARLFESGGLWIVAASFFGFGLLLAFTPCVLPMIPILSGIIAGEGRSIGKLRAFVLSLTYVLGMAVAYAVAGVAAAWSGGILAAALQNAWVLGAFALVFVWLALSMFDLHHVQVPAFIRHHLHRAHDGLEGGRIASVAAMGVLSAVIVSPCVAAPLAGALLYIGQTRDVMLGGAALFAMALGIGAPLVVIGVSEGALLPRAGPWMKGVKQFFGVLLLAVAIWIVSPVLPPMAVLLAWGALAIGCAMFLRALDSLPPVAHPAARIAKGLGIMALVAGVALVVGALAGSRDPLRPLAGLMGESAPAAAAKFVRVATNSELDARLASAGRTVMLDFYADWCVSCKEMEHYTFSDPRVKAKMEGMLLLQADVTANGAEDKTLLKRFSLFGPPGIIFFDAEGREIKGLRVIGYQNAERFLKTLDLAAAR
jgi:thiol:disulfide interchange protein DsbD